MIKDFLLREMIQDAATGNLKDLLILQKESACENEHSRW